MQLKIKRQWIRKLWYAAWGMLAGIVILMALVFSAVRMLLPYAADYKSDIESNLSTATGYQVSIESIEVGWRWFTPQIKLNKLVLNQVNSEQAEYQIGMVEAGIDLFSCVTSLDLSFSYINIINTHIEVSRDKESLFIGDKQIPLSRDSSVERIEIPELLNNKTLRLLDSEIVYRDQVLGIHKILSETNVAFRNYDDSRQLFISVELPENMGGTFEIAFDLTGRQDNPSSWNGNAYARARSLQVSQILKYFPELDAFQNGSIDFELWFDWKNKYDMEVKGDITVTGAELKPASEVMTPALLNSLSMQVYGKRKNKSLELIIKDLQLVRNNHQWEPGQWAALASLDDDDRLKDLQASIDFVRLEDLLPLIQRIPRADGDIISQIEAINPQGELHKLSLYWDKGQAFNLMVDFDNLGMPGNEQLPAISGLRGKLDMTREGGWIYLDSDNVSLFAHNVFRDAMSITHLKSDIRFYRLEGEILLSSDSLLLQVPEVSTHSRFSIWIGNPETQYVDVNATFAQAEIKNKSLYLPAGIMSENVLKWLDESVVGGTISKVEFEFKGYTSEFPFKYGEGKFRAECDFSRAELKYLPDWPVAQGLNGHLKFLGPSMFADVYSARVFDGVVTEVKATIQDLSQPVFLMDAYAFSSGQDALRFIRESSLKDTFGSVVDDMQASGHQGTWLSFAIPMVDDPDIWYAGDSTFFNAQVNLPEFNVSLSELNNKIYFDPTQVSATDSVIKFNQRESVLGIKTIDHAQWRNIHLNVIGQYSFNDLFGEDKHGLLKYLQGESEFSIGMDIPFAVRTGDGLYPNITVGSRLQGIASRLPEPFAKPAKKAKTFYITNRFLSDDRAEFDFYYDDWFKAKFLMEKQAGNIALLNGGVRLGNGIPSISKTDDITITGYLDTLDLDGWMKIRGELASGDGGFLSAVSQIKLDADTIKYLGADFTRAAVSAKKDGHFWLFNIDSPILQGDMQIAESNLMQDGMVIDLKYLDLNAFDMQGNDPVSPKDLPPIKFFSEKLNFRDWRLKNISFLSAPVANGLRIHSLTVDDPALNIRADGEWIDAGSSSQQTNMHITINTKNLGKGIAKLGYADFIKDGQGSAELNIKWPASPAGFDYTFLRGSANLSFVEGQILDVDPGTGGRVFSLINLQTLPRRLALDFKDVFSKGFRFDVAKGDFTFVEGNAYTNNFIIEGPAARIDVAGRTGLVARDYDQNIKVTTQLSGSLPVIGAILGGTSGGLAGILVDRIAKLLGKNSNKQGTVYTIKGSWDDPVIEKIKKKKNDDKAHKEKSG